MKKNIEDLFRDTLADFEQDLSQIDDLNFDKIIAKKPSFWNRNLTYALSATVVVAALIYIGLTPKNETVERKNDLIEDTNSFTKNSIVKNKEIENEPVTIKEKINIQKENSINKGHAQNSAKRNPNMDQLVNEHKPVQEQITPQVTNIEENTIDTREPEMEAIKAKPLRKRHVIVKRDTIFNQDTLRKTHNFR